MRAPARRSRLYPAPNPICAGILAGGLDLYLNSTIITALYKVQILQSESFLISFLYSCKPMKLMLYQAPFAITEIDFVPGPFRCQTIPHHLFAVDSFPAIREAHDGLVGCHERGTARCSRARRGLGAFSPGVGRVETIDHSDVSSCSVPNLPLSPVKHLSERSVVIRVGTMRCLLTRISGNGPSAMRIRRMLIRVGRDRLQAIIA